MILERFGESAPFSLGLEEEIMILDARTLAQVPAVDMLVRETAELRLPGRLKTELFASVVELNTEATACASEALDALARLRREAAAAAGRNGLRIAAAGSHPVSPPEQQAVSPESRYEEFVAYAGVSARRQGVQGLHVHVGMPSGQACYETLEAILPWLPVVLALSCNSPYLAGVDTGLQSNRAEMLAQLPRSGAPPAFGSYAAWERFVERLAAVGTAADHTRYWWDVRPAPQFGTLEVRMPDQPTAIELSGALAALLQALCATVVGQPRAPVDPARRGDYAQNRWAALRFGTRAELIHPAGDRAVAVPELAEELLALVRPAARKLGSAKLLGVLEPSRCEADRQLEIGRSRGLHELCAELVERSLRSL